MQTLETTKKPGQQSKDVQGAGLIFFGIYQIGVDALRALVAAGNEITAVVTKADTVHEVQPVAALARDLGLPVLSPPTLGTPEVIAQLRNLSPRLISVAGYHQKIPQEVLDLPSLGAVNLHGSLLPRYRGPTPWKWAIMRGEQEIGATVHRMTGEFDRGDILGQVVIPITEYDTGESLFRKIAAAGAPLLADVVGQVLDGTAKPQSQDESKSSYFPAIKDEDCQIDFARQAVSIRNLVRGLNPRPGAWTLAQGVRWRVLTAELCPTASPDDPGTLLEISGEGWRVATGTEDLWLQEPRQEDSATDSSALARPSENAVSPGLVLGRPAASAQS